MYGSIFVTYHLLLTRVFNAKIDGNISDLGNILSRKKQVVPSIEKSY